MTTAKPSASLWIALVASALAGSLVAVQSRLNGGLSQHIGNGYVTATISFGIGLVLIVIVMLFNRRARAGIGLVRAELASGHLPKWALTGGLFGASFVVMQGLVATVLGLALFTVGIVAGQVLGGLVMDRIGVGPSGRVAPSGPRVIGTILVIVAVIVSVLADLMNSEVGAGRAWLMVLPVVVGAALSFQAAVNGLLRAAAHSVVTATFVSFLVGFVVLVVAGVISVLVQGWPTSWPDEIYLYLGGPMGVLFIALMAMLVRTVGVLLLSMSNVAGQLVASVALEAGLPLAGGVDAGMLLGAAVALVAVAVAAMPARKRHG